jgi:hypothetical protein
MKIRPISVTFIALIILAAGLYGCGDSTIQTVEKKAPKLTVPVKGRVDIGSRTPIYCDTLTYDDFTLELSGVYYKAVFSGGSLVLSQTAQLPLITIEIKESDTHAIVYKQSGQEDRAYAIIVDNGILVLVPIS